MARNILSDRLNTLVAHGILRRELYQERPQRYEYRLTESGLDLYPVLLTLMDWGARHLGGRAMTLTHKSSARPDPAHRLSGMRRVVRRGTCASSHGRGSAEVRLVGLLGPAFRKNEAKEPAIAVTRKSAVSSSTMSTIRPGVVTGFRICDETVRSCTVVKKKASQRLWISPRPASRSKSHISTVPIASTMATSASASRMRRRST